MQSHQYTAVEGLKRAAQRWPFFVPVLMGDWAARPWAVVVIHFKCPIIRSRDVTHLKNYTTVHRLICAPGAFGRSGARQFCHQNFGRILDRKKYVPPFCVP
jgi:hypothetical protein